MAIAVIGVWILISLVVGLAAAERGRSQAGWTTLALIGSPIIAAILLIAFPTSYAAGPIRITTESERKTRSWLRAILIALAVATLVVGFMRPS